MAYGFFMMRLSQQHEIEADILAIQTTGDPQGFSEMLEALKNEINEQIHEFEEEYAYVTHYLKNIEKTSPALCKSLSSAAQQHYDSMKEHLQDLLDGDGSTHPSLEVRQQIAQNMQQSGT
jgi:Zn-dependent protease with chaperone function